MKKNIDELTEKEAKEILKFVYPNDKYISFRELSFNPKINADGSQQVTMNCDPIIGICYHNGQDNYILHFDDTKVVLWLYQHDYDIEEFLIKNQFYSEMNDDFDRISFCVLQMSKGEDNFMEGNKHNWNLEFVKNRCKELVEKYWFKDYN